MVKIVGVRFRNAGKVYYFDPKGYKIKAGDHVIVETARGVEYGEVALANREIAEGEMVKPLKKLIRIATASDAKVVETNQKRADEAFHICEQKIQEHHLDMKLVSVEYTFDLNKVLFYFTADGRVDFRDLVKDLASVFRTRIELRQIGVRDEAKVLGGLGICGRLMCCLKYEHEVYAELSKITPRPDSLVETPDGPGLVIDSSILRGTCAVRLDGETDEIHTYKCTDCEIVRASRKGRRSSNVATRAAAAAALSSKPKKEIPELPELSIESAPAPVPETAPEKDIEKPAKSRRRRKRRPDSEHKQNSEHKHNAETREKRPHQERPAKSESAKQQPSEKSEKKDSKPRRRRRPHHRGGRKSGGDGQNKSNS